MEHCFCCSGRKKNSAVAVTVTAAAARTQIQTQAYEKLQAEAQEKAHNAEEMIAMVSHDLRAPLSSIQFSLELMSLELENASESVQEELTVAKRNAQRLIGMIDQLLGAQKVRNEKWPPIEVKEVRLSSLMEEAIDNVRSLAANKNITIQGFLTAFEDKGNGVIEADGDRLVQVIVNLLSNAIKFSPANSKIFVSARQTGNNVEVMIEDEGPGVPAELQQAIFAPYVQLNSQSKLPGVGLGLAICREIVEQHKGTIGVRSRASGGSAFWFDIPMHASQTAKVVALSSRKRGAAASKAHAVIA